MEAGAAYREFMRLAYGQPDRGALVQLQQALRQTDARAALVSPDKYIEATNAGLDDLETQRLKLATETALADWVNASPIK